MSEAIIVAGMHTLTIEEIIALKAFVAKVKDTFMTEGVHYMVFGEGDKAKNMLIKPGIEVLLMAFRLSPRFDVKLREFEHHGVRHQEYDALCTLISQVNGAEIAQGMGKCSTVESRYRYVNVGKICPDCGKEGTIKKSKKDGSWYCWDKLGGCGKTWAANHPDIKDQVAGKRENIDIADHYNTVLKMANMRALRDAVLTGLSASDIFDDAEDFEVPDYLMTGKVDAIQPGQSAAASNLLSELRESKPTPKEEVAAPAAKPDPAPSNDQQKADLAPEPEKKPEPVPEKEQASKEPEQSNFDEAKAPEDKKDDIDFDAKITADEWADIKKRLAKTGKNSEQLCNEFGVERGSQLKKVDLPLIDAFINS